MKSKQSILDEILVSKLDELRQNPDVVIVHCETNDIPNNINTVKKIKKLVKEIEENYHENIAQIVISSIINGMIKIIMKNFKALLINFNGSVQVKVCLLLIATISINRVQTRASFIGTDEAHPF